MINQFQIKIVSSLTWMAFNFFFALLSPLKHPLGDIPGVVVRHITVEEGSGKVVMLAQIKEGSERGLLRLLHLLLQVFWSEVDPLAIFQVNTKVHHCGIPLMNGEIKDPPNCLAAA